MSEGETWLREQIATDPTFVVRAMQALSKTNIGELPIPGLDAYFRAIVERGIRESRWFRTAPEEAQKTAVVTVLGVEERTFYGFGTSRKRPAIIAECSCGGESQRFSLLLDNTDYVEPIN